MKRAPRGFSARHWMVLCGVLIATAAQPGKAEVVWSDQAGPWQVTLFRGERSDAWCSWTVGGQPGLGRSQRSMSLQMRGEDVVLFLFVAGLSPFRWRPGASITLRVDEREIAIELDQVRLLANGFSMLRGVVAQDAEAMVRFARDFGERFLSFINASGRNELGHGHGRTGCHGAAHGELPSRG